MGAILYIEKDQVHKDTWSLVESVTTVQLDIILSGQLNYNTVVTLSQVKNAKGGDIYVDFSCMDHHQRW